MTKLTHLEDKIEDKVSWTRFIWIIGIIMGGLSAFTMIGFKAITVWASAGMDENQASIQILEQKIPVLERLDERTKNIQENIRELKIIIQK